MLCLFYLKNTLLDIILSTICRFVYLLNKQDNPFFLLLLYISFVYLVFSSPYSNES